MKKKICKYTIQNHRKSKQGFKGKNDTLRSIDLNIVATPFDLTGQHPALARIVAGTSDYIAKNSDSYPALSYRRRILRENVIDTVKDMERE